MLKTALQYVILQHPQEKKKKLSSVPLLKESLENVVLKSGLSWPNLTKILGRKEVDYSRWAVIYLGTAKQLDEFNSNPYNKNSDSSLVAFNRKNNRVNLNTLNLEGVVLLDGNWSQSKTLWWRNSWLLKLNRIMINPKKKSLYGKLRREPRKACLSTLESVAEIILSLEKNENVSNELLEKFKAFLSSQEQVNLQMSAIPVPQPCHQPNASVLNHN